MNWPIAFVLTQLIEISVALCIWKDIPKRKVCLYVFCASALTHPIVWFVFPGMMRQYQWDYGTFLLFAESYAYLVEILWYAAVRASRPIFISCAANTCSMLTGLLIQYLLRTV